jgi:protein SEY1
MNLKLFQQECSKKILIVLRDFDSSRNVKSKIEEMILKDIKLIWNDIKKPEKYKDSEPSNFFEFEFITLPHKKYFEEKFNDEVKDLRKRLEAGHPQYFFNHVSSEKNVPADGIKQYISQLWDDIINEKELNIPSQKEMLSNYRCNEIKDNVLMENDQAVRDIQNLSAKENVDDFTSKCLAIADKIFKDYDKTASNYLDKIYMNVRKQLEANLSQKFYMCFANQAKRIIPISQKYMRQELQREIKNSKK